MENIKHHSLSIKSVQTKMFHCTQNFSLIKFHNLSCSHFYGFCYHQLVTFIGSLWYLYWFYITLSFTSCKLILFFKTFNFCENPSSSLSITIRPGHSIFHGKIKNLLSCCLILNQKDHEKITLNLYSCKLLQYKKC